MTRAVGRAVATALLGALLGAAWLAFFYVADPRLRVSFDTDPPKLLNGVYPSERDRASGRTFAWTGADVALRLPGIDRSVDWTLEVTARGARPDPRQNPVLTFSADGMLIGTRQTTTDFSTLSITIPASPERRRGLVLTMQSSATFVPGPNDPRALGVMLDDLSLNPSGVVLPPRRAFAGAAATPAALGAAVALLGVTPGTAVAAAVLLSAGGGSLMARGFGPFTAYPIHAAQAAGWVGLLLFAVAGGVQIVRRQPLRNTARFVAAFSAGAVFLKLLVLLHPDMPIGDALFHAHRFQWVLDGRLYFTSIAPGNYLFPYAPGLYVFASPFAWLVTRGPADMTLLRVVVLGVDAVAGVFLYLMIVRAWGDRMAGAMAVAIYHLLPLSFGIVTTGNLTNAFAQSLAVLVLALLTISPIGWRRPAWMVLLSFALAAAFVSHTSTFAILFPTSLFVAAAFLWKGGPAQRSPAGAVLVAALAALAVSVILYYGHFGDTYRTEFARLGQETATGAADAGGRGILTRMASVPRYLQSYLGLPALALAGAGGWQLWRRAARDRLTLAVSAWVVSCLMFLAVGVLTPVDMRYYLASIPVVAILSAAGASSLWSAAGPSRWAAGMLLVWVIWSGTRTWWSAF